MMQVNLKFVLCIIYIIMILGAIISLPFLVMVVGNKVNNYHRTQALEMVSKREVAGASKARFTPPKMDADPNLIEHGHNHHRHRHRHQLNHDQQQHEQDQQELHQQSSSPFSSLSPSLPALETTFINQHEQQSSSSFESTATLHQLSPSSSSLPINIPSTSLHHHHTNRKRRKKKRIRDEVQVDESLEAQTDPNLIELNTYSNPTSAPTSSPPPPSSLILDSFPSSYTSSSSSQDYQINNDNNQRRTSSNLISTNLKIENSNRSSNKKNKFTAKYFYLYNRCSGHKVQILGMKKVSAAPVTTFTSSGQSQPSSASSSPSHRRHHSLLYTLHHQEQLPVSFSTTGDLLDDDYAVMSLESYNLGLDPRTNVPRIGIKIQGKKSGLFLCYNKRGKLVNKFVGSSSGCLYTESPSDNNYWTFDSVLNPDWSIGFNRRGKPLPGQIAESVTVPRSISSRKGKCHQFVKLPIEIKLIEERKMLPDQNEEEAEKLDGTDDEEEDEDEISTLNRD